MPLVDQINFIRDRINPKDLVSLGGEAPRGNGPDISQAKDADFQRTLHYPSFRLLPIIRVRAFTPGQPFAGGTLLVRHTTPRCPSTSSRPRGEDAPTADEALRVKRALMPRVSPHTLVP